MATFDPRARRYYASLQVENSTDEHNLNFSSFARGLGNEKIHMNLTLA